MSAQGQASADPTTVVPKWRPRRAGTVTIPGRPGMRDACGCVGLAASTSLRAPQSKDRGSRCDGSAVLGSRIDAKGDCLGRSKERVPDPSDESVGRGSVRSPALTRPGSGPSRTGCDVERKNTPLASEPQSDRCRAASSGSAVPRSRDPPRGFVNPRSAINYGRKQKARAPTPKRPGHYFLCYPKFR